MEIVSVERYERIVALVMNYLGSQSPIEWRRCEGSVERGSSEVRKSGLADRAGGSLVILIMLHNIHL